jgi:hypothetical protein
MALSARKEIAQLKAELAELKAQLAPQIPVPERTAKLPSWASQTDGTNVGMNHQGPPSVTPSADGVSWVTRRRPNGDWFDPNSGQWRDHATGAPVPATIEPRPLAGDDARLRGNVQLLDTLIARDENLGRR